MEEFSKDVTVPFQNVSLDESIKEQLNGNNKYNMDSLGFGFSVGTEPDKATDGLIQDFERIQKDTTDFCNIQVSKFSFFLENVSYLVGIICKHTKISIFFY